MANYVGEDLTIEFRSGTDLTGATALIKIKSPSGGITSRTATITDEANGVFSIEINPGDLPVPGRYYFWGHVTDSSGEISISDPQNMVILSEGTLS